MTWTLALSLLEIAWVLGIGLVIVLEKRSPLATTTWILGMALLPYVGLFIWFTFGPRRLRKRRSDRARVRESIDATWPFLLREAESEETADPAVRALQSLAANAMSAPVWPGNDVRLLRNGTESYRAIGEAVQAAKHHVHVEFYIFAMDATGKRFRDLLIEKRRAGVEVRILVDGVGSRWNAAFTRPMEEAGIEFASFNPVAIWRLGSAFNARNHRKLVVCDGRVAFTGGLNVADEYIGVPPDVSGWRDTHARFEGPAAQAFQRLFLQDWNYATGRSLHSPAYFEHGGNAGPHVVQVVGSGPDDAWHSVEQLVVAAINGASTRVRITTPYFIPDEPLFTTLVSAALRGVDVQVLVPRRSDSELVLAASRSYFDELLSAGVRLYEYLPTMLHAKTMTIDGRLAFVGTANMDPRSFRLNYELTGIAYCEPTARELDDLFERDLTVSKEVTREDRAALPMIERIRESTARIFTPVL